MKTVFPLKWKGNILKIFRLLHVKICIVLFFLKDSFSLGIALKRSVFFFFLFSSKFSKCREKPILSFAKSSGIFFWMLYTECQ